MTCSVLPDLDGTLIDSFWQAALLHYADTNRMKPSTYPGIGQFLEAMKQVGSRLYLATSKRAVFARRVLDHLKLTAHRR